MNEITISSKYTLYLFRFVIGRVHKIAVEKKQAQYHPGKSRKHRPGRLTVLGEYTHRCETSEISKGQARKKNCCVLVSQPTLHYRPDPKLFKVFLEPLYLKNNTKGQNFVLFE